MKADTGAWWADRAGRLPGDGGLLERVRHEVLTVPAGWRAEYGDFQSGGWWTLSLLNATGAETDVTIGDCDPVATGLLAEADLPDTVLAARMAGSR